MYRKNNTVWFCKPDLLLEDKYLSEVHGSLHDLLTPYLAISSTVSCYGEQFDVQQCSHQSAGTCAVPYVPMCFLSSFWKGLLYVRDREPYALQGGFNMFWSIYYKSHMLYIPAHHSPKIRFLDLKIALWLRRSTLSAATGSHALQYRVKINLQRLGVGLRSFVFICVKAALLLLRVDAIAKSMDWFEKSALQIPHNKHHQL